MLEDQGAPMIADWHRPVAAVLDAFGLEDVTLVGGSLGGCLAIRAAAADFFAVLQAQQPAAIAMLVRGMLAIGAHGVIDRTVRRPTRRQALGVRCAPQGEHVFGRERPSEMLQTARAFETKDISQDVRADVVLLAGKHDHYVPLEQLWGRARSLTAARSITARVFTPEEHAQAHCQVGNLPLVLRVISDWVDACSR